ncbi:hypothetical protein [Bradyrhizobium sp. SRS-191]|uniref:hypothetical protein n=1 Tax=Bradyrhizobium sp. SRS-191 TaxID=2962606 RepID=UPI00211DDE62|nr:hypothetical protein [Bradyrhizobium sp. SRS-191]
MLLAVVLAWACNVTGMACGAPTTEIIQKAYEQEAPASGVRHDKGLKIVEATCGKGDENGRFLCQVSFVSEDDPDKRLYFDIVSAALTDKGWVLTSGLCKR